MKYLRQVIPPCLFFFLLAVLCVSPVFGQPVPVGDELEDYARLRQLQGLSSEFSFSVRPLSADVLLPETADAEHPWSRWFDRYVPVDDRFHIGAMESQLAAYWNSSEPYGFNDGAVWRGKGTTLAGEAGAYGRIGPVSAAFRPQVTIVQNLDFRLSSLPRNRGLSPFAYRNSGVGLTIDAPQRFGEEPIQQLNLGQSFVKAEYRRVGLGLSHENLWWGPALINPIAMSNNAPGFTHGFIGTSGPVDIWIGEAQGRWVWSMLTESEYFDSDDTNDDRYFTGIVLDFSPQFLPNLSVGLTRTFLKYASSPNVVWGPLYTQGVTFRDFFKVFEIPLFKVTQQAPNNPHGFDETDQMATVFGRWVFPESGFELYGEWGKGDHSWNLRDLLIEPEHASGYTLGFQKVFDVEPTKWIRVMGELTKLESPRTLLTRGSPGFFYVHWQPRQGYSHRGQLIGAPIGPGSNSQYLGVDVYTSRGRIGAFFMRVVPNKDRFFRVERVFWKREVDLNFGLRALFFISQFELEGNAVYRKTLNKDYQARYDVSNVGLGLSVRYHWARHR